MGRRGPSGIDPRALLELERYWLNLFSTMQANEPGLFKSLGRITSPRQLYRICKDSATLTKEQSPFKALIHIRGERFLDGRGRRTSVQAITYSMMAAQLGKAVGTIENLLCVAHRQFASAKQCLCGHLEEEHASGECGVCRCNKFVQPCACGHDETFHTDAGCEYHCNCRNFVGGSKIPRYGRTIPLADSLPADEALWDFRNFEWPLEEDIVTSNWCSRCGHLRAAHVTKCRWKCACTSFRGGFRFVRRSEAVRKSRG